MKKVFTILVLIVLIWSCSKKTTPVKSNIPSNTVSSNPTGSSTLSQLVDTSVTYGAKKLLRDSSITSKDITVLGQSTYNAKCGTCHGLKVTTNYTADRWASIMAVENTRANLTETEKVNVLAYVKANSKK